MMLLNWIKEKEKEKDFSCFQFFCSYFFTSRESLFREISYNHLIAKVYSAKFTKIVQPRKFLPAKCINFAVRLNRESFFQRKFLPLKYCNH